ncbi:acyltransferase domain-containing protein [Sphingomonas sp. SFZ2018-12]|uniref:ACP S-malonyltransferase n=1 Tax=Sphingomonas sp. SFZ2018-12 TaxID=2683197 RepID=UPI001F102696|nr:ACP S-malonyltransferase [Sphingomonas sp. SFZ2018-12]MCH4894273.1 acyltransferase domain-containing protein [Sphingomonas sp. SFZ2018-12]
MALLFPGQGAQHPSMLDAVRAVPEFDARYALVRETVGSLVIDRVERGDDVALRSNKASSLLTILASSLAWLAWDRASDVRPSCVAGYSVGQWTALHAAGALDFETLVRVVSTRADFMDECMRGEPGGMYAVLGLPLGVVNDQLARLREDGHLVWVSNVNCPGNCSIAGTLTALAAAVECLAALTPKKLAPVPVSGAWHSPLLSTAADRFHDALLGIELAPTAIPIVDNVTGGWLADDPSERRAQLARHLTSPVLWQSGMQTCLASCRRFIELGHGGSLTKLGFFLDRRAEFETYRPDAQPPVRPVACAG